MGVSVPRPRDASDFRVFGSLERFELQAAGRFSDVLFVDDSTTTGSVRTGEVVFHRTYRGWAVGVMARITATRIFAPDDEALKRFAGVGPSVRFGSFRGLHLAVSFVPGFSTGVSILNVLATSLNVPLLRHSMLAIDIEAASRIGFGDSIFFSWNVGARFRIAQRVIVGAEWRDRAFGLIAGMVLR